MSPKKTLASGVPMNTVCSFFTPRPTRRKASGGVIVFQKGGVANAR